MGVKFAQHSGVHINFKVNLERIMFDALEENDGKVSVGGRPISNLQFAAMSFKLLLGKSRNKKP